MPNLNKSIFIGNVVRDPEMKYVPSGEPVTNFSVAVNEKAKNGETTTMYVACSAFGKLAEICGDYLKKGQPVYVEGPIRVREYESKGEKRFSLDLRVRDMQMLGSKGQQDEDGGDDGGRSQTREPVGVARGSGRKPVEDIDIPF